MLYFYLLYDTVSKLPNELRTWTALLQVQRILLIFFILETRMRFLQKADKKRNTKANDVRRMVRAQELHAMLEVPRKIDPIVRA